MGRIGRHSRLHQWIKEGPLTLSEFKGFIATILNMGLIKKPSIEQYWREGVKSQSTPWFRHMFTRNRFQLLLKFFHLVDNRKIKTIGQNGYNPAGKFKPLIDHFNMRSKYLYTPDQKLSVDESLVATKARSVMTQYIPTKHSKFGIKLWMLVEAVTGYIMRIIVYRGKQYDPTPVGRHQATDVVHKLLAESHLLYKNYHVYCDSFFSSINLARHLLSFGTYLTGTLRKNRPMPRLIKNPSLNENESVFLRSGKTLVVAYKEGHKKPVRLLSTFHSAKLKDNKPKVITKYNKYMGGVDLNDMLTSFYGDNRKSVKMWKKVVFNLLQRFLINSYVLYTKNTTDSPVMTRLRYTESVIESLSEEHLQHREQTDRHVRRIKPNLVKSNKPKECIVCSNRRRGIRKRTIYICSQCRNGVHPLCAKKHNCRGSEQ